MRKVVVPGHLSPDSAGWFRTLMKTYAFEAHQVRLLQVACEAWDRKEQARLELASDGLTVVDGAGMKRAHPCVVIERDARVAFLRAVRELSLSDDDVADIRPPRLGGYR